jgi:hypothetical protein
MTDEQLPMIAEHITASYRAGMESERLFFLGLLQPIFSAYVRAELDPQAKIPRALMAAIVAARAQFVTVTPAVRERRRV